MSRRRPGKWGLEGRQFVTARRQLDQSGEGVRKGTGCSARSGKRRATRHERLRARQVVAKRLGSNQRLRAGKAPLEQVLMSAPASSQTLGGLADLDNDRPAGSKPQTDDGGQVLGTKQFLSNVCAEMGATPSVDVGEINVLKPPAHSPIANWSHQASGSRHTGINNQRPLSTMTTWAVHQSQPSDCSHFNQVGCKRLDRGMGVQKLGRRYAFAFIGLVLRRCDSSAHVAVCVTSIAVFVTLIRGRARERYWDEFEYPRAWFGFVRSHHIPLVDALRTRLLAAPRDLIEVNDHLWQSTRMPAREFEPPELGRPNLARALTKMLEWHGKQSRKGKPTVTHIGHLMGVASIVIEAGGSDTLAVSALLHDTLEDQPDQVTSDLLESQFGPEVAGIVVECTDSDPSAPDEPRDEAT